MARYKATYKDGSYVAPTHITDDMIIQAMEEHELKKNNGMAKLNNCTIIAPLRRRKCSARQSLREFYENYHYPLDVYDTARFDEPKALREMYAWRAEKRRKIIFKFCLFFPVYLLCVIYEAIRNTIHVFTERRGVIGRAKQVLQLFALTFLGTFLSYIVEIFAGRDSFSLEVIIMMIAFSALISCSLCALFTSIVKHWGCNPLLPGPLHKFNRDLFEYYYKSPKYGNSSLLGVFEINYENNFPRDGSIIYLGEDAIYSARKPKSFSYMHKPYEILKTTSK